MTGVNITGVNLDKTVYNIGDQIDLTVDYTQTAVIGGQGNVNYTLTITLTDSVTGVVSQSQKTFIVDTGSGATPDPVTITATDNRPTPGTWVVFQNTLGSDGTGQAILTSTA